MAIRWENLKHTVSEIKLNFKQPLILYDGMLQSIKTLINPNFSKMSARGNSEVLICVFLWMRK